MLNCFAFAFFRSIELVKAAKQYIEWTQNDAIMEGYESILIRNNERMFVLANGVGAKVQIIARPKNPESCRGDAPKACIFDEVGFISRKLWDSFAYPLLQVGGRVFTCATTPPPPNNFFSIFSQMVKERNSEGDFFFMLINHSLSCQQCLDSGDAMACAHNLAHLPPWKSLCTLRQMSGLVADKDVYQAEVYGVLLSGGATYLPRALLDAATSRKRVTEFETASIVWIAIDPPAHKVSDMGMVAFVLNAQGLHVVIGLGNINLARAMTTEVQLCVHQFLTRIRKHPAVGRHTVIVPILECNNNEVLVMSLLSTFRNYPPVDVPFTDDKFRTCITSGIGTCAGA